MLFRAHPQKKKTCPGLIYFSLKNKREITQEQKKKNPSQSKENDLGTQAHLGLCFTCDRKCDMSWLYMALPRLLLSEGKPGSDLQLVSIMRTRGTEERILPAQFEGLVEAGQKGRLFVLPKKQTVADGTYDVPSPASIKLWLAPSSLKSIFLLKGRGLGLAIC